MPISYKELVKSELKFSTVNWFIVYVKLFVATNWFVSFTSTNSGSVVAFGPGRAVSIRLAFDVSANAVFANPIFGTIEILLAARRQNTFPFIANL